MSDPRAPWFGPLIDGDVIPEPMLRAIVRSRLRHLLRSLERGGPRETAARAAALREELAQAPITPAARRSNEQHYEVPPEFFELFLGPRLKYSACLWPDGQGAAPSAAAPPAPAGPSSADDGEDGGTSRRRPWSGDGLDGAEEAMLALSCERAGIEDGQEVLDLGCGWGSATLWIAGRFPRCAVTAVSNSGPQGESIRRRALEAGLDNVTVHTADAARFDPGRRFDRIVSVEMLEHLRNYPAILSRVAHWLEPDGAFFVHVFSHRSYAYLFDETARGDWMARYFFAGGTMPSHDLLPSFAGGLPATPLRAPDGPTPALRCTADWWLPGTHYARTLETWLARYDARRDEVMPVLAATYGAADADAWWARWRLFFISCAETFAFRGGSEWGVSHYVFRPR